MERTHGFVNVVFVDHKADVYLRRALGDHADVGLRERAEDFGGDAARARNLRVIGTLGVLDIAAAHGWINLRTTFERLRKTTFRSPHRLMTATLEQDEQRKKRSKDK